MKEIKQSAKHHRNSQDTSFASDCSCPRIQRPQKWPLPSKRVCSKTKSTQSLLHLFEILERFSEKIERSWADWLFVKKDLKRIIASLELLATLVAVRLWTKTDSRSNGVCWIRAGTDNQSNTYAISKMMSTKYPLATLLVMELSETLRARSCELNLHWIPRDRNQLADDLTNEKFDAFDGLQVKRVL